MIMWLANNIPWPLWAVLFLYFVRKLYKWCKSDASAKDKDGSSVTARKRVNLEPPEFFFDGREFVPACQWYQQNCPWDSDLSTTSRRTQRRLWPRAAGHDDSWRHHWTDERFQEQSDSSNDDSGEDDYGFRQPWRQKLDGRHRWNQRENVYSFQSRNPRSRVIKSAGLVEPKDRIEVRLEVVKNTPSDYPLRLLREEYVQ